MDKVDVYYYTVGEDPVMMTIDDSLEAFQKMVGGWIEQCWLFDDYYLFCNEEGAINGSRLNRVFYKDGVKLADIYGDFFIAKSDEEGNWITFSPMNFYRALEVSDVYYLTK